MVETNLINRKKITQEVKDEIILHSHTISSIYARRKEFYDQVAKLLNLIMYLTGQNNYIANHSFYEGDNEDDVDIDYFSDIIIRKSRFKKYKYCFDFNIRNGIIKYTFLDCEVKSIYLSDNFDELFEKINKDYLEWYVPNYIEVAGSLRGDSND